MAKTKKLQVNVLSTFKEKGKMLVMSAPFWVLIMGITILLIFSIHAGYVYNNRFDTRMAEIWSQGSDVSYRHLAVYSRGVSIIGDNGPKVYQDFETSLSLSDIQDIRNELQSTIGKSGLNGDGSPNGWEDAYSSFCQKNIVVGEVVSTETEVVGVGGNFKAFHPFVYMSGGFLPKNAIDKNSIVINQALSWHLFKSYDVVGNIISIDNEKYSIVGVVKEPDNNEERAYVYFDKFESWISSATSAMNASDSDLSYEPAIICYEVMLPELVKGVGEADTKNAIQSYNSTDPNFYIVSVTDRYSIKRLWDYVFPIGDTNTFLSAFDLPYWETTQGVASEKLAVDIALTTAGGILVIIGFFMFGLKRPLKSSDIEEKM